MKRQKITKLWLILVLFIGFIINTKAANPEWKFLLPWFVITTVCEDGEFMWIGTNNFYTYKLDKSTLQLVDTIKLSANKIIKDKNGVVWIASNIGLIKYENGEKTYYNRMNSELPRDELYDIVCDSDNNLWILTLKEIIKFDGIEWKVFDSNLPEFQLGILTCITTNRKNDILIGTLNKGIVKFDGTKIEFLIDTAKGLPTNDVRAMVVDKKNDIWLSTKKALCKYDGAILDIFDKVDNLDSLNAITELAIDSMNNLWCGTNSFNFRYGVIKYDGVKWESFTTKNSDIRGNGINSISVDSKNNIWIGVASDNFENTGLNIFNENGIILGLNDDIKMETNDILIEQNYIKISAHLISAKYNIFNIVGELIESGIIDSEYIELSHLNEGCYLLQTQKQNKISIYKFIKR